MDLVRMRVEVPDVPGALARLTAALGGLGADIVDVDVLEVDGETVVDEVVVRLPERLSLLRVKSAVRSAGAGDVLSVAPAGRRGDPVVESLHGVAAVAAAAEPGRAAELLLTRLGYGDEAQLVEHDAAQAFPLAVRALQTGVPSAARAGGDTSPLGRRRGWVLWAAPAVPDPQWAVVVHRRYDVRFAAGEAARLRALVTALAAAGVRPEVSAPAG